MSFLTSWWGYMSFLFLFCFPLFLKLISGRCKEEWKSNQESLCDTIIWEFWMRRKVTKFKSQPWGLVCNIYIFSNPDEAVDEPLGMEENDSSMHCLRLLHIMKLLSSNYIVCMLFINYELALMFSVVFFMDVHGPGWGISKPGPSSELLVQAWPKPGLGHNIKRPFFFLCLGPYVNWFGYFCLIELWCVQVLHSSLSPQLFLQLSWALALYRSIQA